MGVRFSVRGVKFSIFGTHDAGGSVRFYRTAPHPYEFAFCQNRTAPRRAVEWSETRIRTKPLRRATLTKTTAVRRSSGLSKSILFCFDAATVRCRFDRFWPNRTAPYRIEMKNHQPKSALHLVRVTKHKKSATPRVKTTNQNSHRTAPHRESLHIGKPYRGSVAHRERPGLECECVLFYMGPFRGESMYVQV